MPREAWSADCATGAHAWQLYQHDHGPSNKGADWQCQIELVQLLMHLIFVHAVTLDVHFQAVI